MTRLYSRDEIARWIECKLAELDWLDEQLELPVSEPERERSDGGTTR